MAKSNSPNGKPRRFRGDAAALRKLEGVLRSKQKPQTVDAALRKWQRDTNPDATTSQQAKQLAAEVKAALGAQEKVEARRVIAEGDHLGTICHVLVIGLALAQMGLNSLGFLLGACKQIAGTHLLQPDMLGQLELLIAEHPFRVALLLKSIALGVLLPVAILGCGAVFGRLLNRNTRYHRCVAAACAVMAIVAMAVSVSKVTDALVLLTGTSWLQSLGFAVVFDGLLLVFEAATIKPPQD